ERARGGLTGGKDRISEGRRGELQGVLVGARGGVRHGGRSLRSLWFLGRSLRSLVILWSFNCQSQRTKLKEPSPKIKASPPPASRRRCASPRRGRRRRTRRSRRNPRGSRRGRGGRRRGRRR